MPLSSSHPHPPPPCSCLDCHVARLRSPSAHHQPGSCRGGQHHPRSCGASSRPAHAAGAGVGQGGLAAPCLAGHAGSRPLAAAGAGHHVCCAAVMGTRHFGPQLQKLRAGWGGPAASAGSTPCGPPCCRNAYTLQLDRAVSVRPWFSFRCSGSLAQSISPLPPANPLLVAPPHLPLCPRHLAMPATHTFVLAYRALHPPDINLLPCLPLLGLPCCSAACNGQPFLSHLVLLLPPVLPAPQPILTNRATQAAADPLTQVSRQQAPSPLLPPCTEKNTSFELQLSSCNS